MYLLPAEIIAEIAIKDVDLWRKLFISGKAQNAVMRLLLDRAKAAFATWEVSQGRASNSRWQRLPNGWRHGRWEGVIKCINGVSETILHYKNDRLHGACEIRWNGELRRKWTMYESKADGDWMQWDDETKELEGWVTLYRGKVVKVHKWIYARYDPDTKKIIVGDPLDSEFVM